MSTTPWPTARPASTRRHRRAVAAGVWLVALVAIVAGVLGLGVGPAPRAAAAPNPFGPGGSSTLLVTLHRDGSVEIVEEATVDLRLAYRIGASGTLRQAFRTGEVADGFPVWVLPTWSDPTATVDGSPLPLTVERRHRALRVTGGVEQQPGRHVVRLRYRVSGAAWRQGERWVVPVTPFTPPGRVTVTGPGVEDVNCLGGRSCGEREADGWTVDDPPSSRVNGQVEPESGSGLGQPWAGELRLVVAGDALSGVADPVRDPR